MAINIDLKNGGALITLRMLSKLNRNFLKPMKKLRKGQAMFDEFLVPVVPHKAVAEVSE